jgi:hypothetical protein
MARTGPGATVERQARAGQLYPSVILHGGSQRERVAVAVALARAVLCAGAAGGGPRTSAAPAGATAPSEPSDCACRHCRRIQIPEEGAVVFHPDVHFLWQDLRTVTSTDATRQWLRAAQLHPFEARGQVFVVMNAETLSDEAANVLLKMLEEPPRSAPRHFLLLTPSSDRLLPTVRSRSMAVYLGAVERPDPERVAAVAADFARALEAYGSGGSPIHLLAAADALLAGGSWDDPRDPRPFTLAASAVVAAYRAGGGAARAESSSAMLALAEDLLLFAPEARTRNVAAQRILEGLLSKHLAGAGA